MQPLRHKPVAGRKRGFALVAVLWLVALLALISQSLIRDGTLAARLGGAGADR